MNQNKSPKVWYASEKRINSITKFLVFDDSGTLEISNKTIEFRGPKNTINIDKNNIKNISLVKQKINWVTYVISNIALLIYIKSRGVELNATVLVYFIIFNIFGFLVGMNTKWLEITYTENGADKKVYFASAGMLGWSGIFGGTKKIYDSLQNK